MALGKTSPGLELLDSTLSKVRRSASRSDRIGKMDRLKPSEELDDLIHSEVMGCVTDLENRRSARIPSPKYSADLKLAILVVGVLSERGWFLKAVSYDPYAGWYTTTFGLKSGPARKIGERGGTFSVSLCNAAIKVIRLTKESGV